MKSIFAAFGAPYERLICNPYLIIFVPRFARADNGKIRAANESSALKMNIIVILIRDLQLTFTQKGKFQM